MSHTFQSTLLLRGVTHFGVHNEATYRLGRLSVCNHNLSFTLKEMLNQDSEMMEPGTQQVP